MKISRKLARVIAVAAAAVTFTGAGIAYGTLHHWVTFRTQPGVMGELSDLIVSDVENVYDTGYTALWPGHPVSVRFKATNPNSQPAYISDIELFSFSASGSCTGELLYLGVVGKTMTDPVHVPPADLPTSPVPPGGSLVVLVPNAVAMPEAAFALCEGRHFQTGWKVAGTVAPPP